VPNVSGGDQARIENAGMDARADRAAVTLTRVLNGQGAGGVEKEVVSSKRYDHKTLRTDFNIGNEILFGEGARNLIAPTNLRTFFYGAESAMYSNTKGISHHQCGACRRNSDQCARHPNSVGDRL
jgi:hypothetical protein